MKKVGLLCLAVILTLLGLNITPTAVQSARGTPDSPDFGYGMALDLEGSHVLDSIPYAATISIDWLAVTFDWGKHWPDPSRQPDLASLDQVMTLAGQYKLPVMLKLTDAPGWARSQSGPTPERTAWFVVNLAERYPATLQSVEIYPGANTVSGWGSAPDASAYFNLFNYTQASLKQAKLASVVTLVAAGLTPLPAPQPAPADEDDIDFLNALYKLGAGQTMPVISLVLPDLTGDPLKTPQTGEHRVLRHYEEIRQVMPANQDPQGILWITGFHWPSGKISPDDVSLRDNLANQNEWLIQAYRQLRSQLYLGVAFFDSLNPPGEARASQIGHFSLVGEGLTKHPFFTSLMEIIAQNNRQQNLPLTFDHPQSKHIFKDRNNPP
jgi:hypothetical protein